MSIKEIRNDGVVVFEVNISLRSKIVSSIRVQKRKTVNTYSEAQKTEKMLRESALREVFEKENAGCTWGRLVENWENSLPRRNESDSAISGLSAEDYSTTIRTWTQCWWNIPAAEINPGDVKAVMREVIAQGRSKSTQEKLRTSINSVFNWGIENRALKGVIQSPAMGLKLSSGRQEEKKPEILTYIQIKTLLQYAQNYDSPWYYIWAFALLTGMRSGELQALTWSDVNLEHDVIHVHRNYNRRTRKIGPTKGRYWREVPISSELKDVLMELKASGQRGEFVLPRISDWERGEQARFLRSFCNGIGIPSVRFHTLRACFATQLLRKGIPSVVVMRIGGWKTLKTMERYIRLSGIEIAGATEGLNFTSPKEAAANVVNLFNRSEIPPKG